MINIYVSILVFFSQKAKTYRESKEWNKIDQQQQQAKKNNNNNFKQILGKHFLT